MNADPDGSSKGSYDEPLSSSPDPSDDVGVLGELKKAADAANVFPCNCCRSACCCGKLNCKENSPAAGLTIE